MLEHWHATELARTTPAGTVAVFGAGTVGLLSAYSALCGARPWSTSSTPYPSDWTRPGGSVPCRWTTGRGDPVEQIRELRRAAGLPPGEAPLDGVQIGIDAVGFQAHDRADPGQENPTQVVHELARLIDPTGHLGIVGVYAEKDLHPAPEGHADGRLWCRGPPSSARGSRWGSVAPTTVATPCCCATW